MIYSPSKTLIKNLLQRVILILFFLILPRKSAIETSKEWFSVYGIFRVLETDSCTNDLSLNLRNLLKNACKLEVVLITKRKYFSRVNCTDSRGFAKKI